VYCHRVRTSRSAGLARAGGCSHHRTGFAVSRVLHRYRTLLGGALSKAESHIESYVPSTATTEYSPRARTRPSGGRSIPLRPYGLQRPKPVIAGGRSLHGALPIFIVKIY
jgi:hypothetical protein